MDLTEIRGALAAQITAQTGLRAEAQVRDQVSPPVALVLPGRPLISFGQTMSGGGVPGAVAINLAVVLLLSNAPPSEKVQRSIDDLLGIGPGDGQSIADAVMADPTLGGTVEWCMPQAVSQYGRVEYAAESYWGATMTLQVGAT
jgi:hypothetical protein